MIPSYRAPLYLRSLKRGYKVAWKVFLKDSSGGLRPFRKPGAFTFPEGEWLRDNNPSRRLWHHYGDGEVGFHTFRRKEDALQYEKVHPHAVVRQVRVREVVGRMVSTEGDDLLVCKEIMVPKEGKRGKM